MKTIAIIGDSHTWGQGTAGPVDYLNRTTQTVQCGELRLMPFCFGSFVNRLRDDFLRQGKSDIWEEQGRCSLPTEVIARGGLLRLQLAAQGQPGRVTVRQDGASVWQEELPVEGVPMPVSTVTLHTQPGQRIQLEGQGFLLRTEHYDGEIAVVNCGIGSCPTKRFLSDFWPRYVNPLKAEIMLIEPCTINDWLSGITPEQYQEDTQKLFRQARAEGAQPIMLSVSPIGGDQQLEQCAAPYEDYIVRAYQAAQAEQVPVADAHAAMAAALQGLTEEQKNSKLFDDPWHPNDFGHEMYARIAMEEIEKYL